MLADAQVSWCDPTAHVEGFSCQKREAEDHGVILVTSKASVYVEGRECIRGSAHKLKAIIWVLGAEHFGNLLRSHQPSVATTSVPLMK